ncbi:2'-5' RNA ligase family protein [Dokdonella sp. MW10]|uniref:2'-5' RNA ligase family protein n=1 Tax=Dokdonella sp. MW10 TaxID=2992926 RepID=UPI003F7DC283
MSRSRWLFVARPPESVRDAIAAALDAVGLRARLGDAAFAIENWHQSLSDRQWHISKVDAMQRAGARVRATQVKMILNRVVNRGESPRLHWTLLAQGQPEGFAELLNALRVAEAAEGLVDVVGNTPHITLSYDAPSPLEGSVSITPVMWTLDHLELVHGGGDPYGYETIDRWPLDPSPQGGLFG